MEDRGRQTLEQFRQTVNGFVFGCCILGTLVRESPRKRRLRTGSLFDCARLLGEASTQPKHTNVQRCAHRLQYVRSASRSGERRYGSRAYLWQLSGVGPEVHSGIDVNHRTVGRLLLGTHGKTTNEAVKGDRGWTGFEVWEAQSKVRIGEMLRKTKDSR